MQYLAASAGSDADDCECCSAQQQLWQMVLWHTQQLYLEQWVCGAVRQDRWRRQRFSSHFQGSFAYMLHCSFSHSRETSTSNTCALDACCRIASVQIDDEHHTIQTSRRQICGRACNVVLFALVYPLWRSEPLLRSAISFSAGVLARPATRLRSRRAAGPTGACRTASHSSSHVSRPSPATSHHHHGSTAVNLTVISCRQSGRPCVSTCRRSRAVNDNLLSAHHPCPAGECGP